MLCELLPPRPRHRTLEECRRTETSRTAPGRLTCSFASTAPSPCSCCSSARPGGCQSPVCQSSLHSPRPAHHRCHHTCKGQRQSVPGGETGRKPGPDSLRSIVRCANRRDRWRKFFETLPMTNSGNPSHCTPGDHGQKDWTLTRLPRGGRRCHTNITYPLRITPSGGASVTSYRPGRRD